MGDLFEQAAGEFVNAVWQAMITHLESDVALAHAALEKVTAFALHRGMAKNSELFQRDYDMLCERVATP